MTTQITPQQLQQLEQLIDSAPFKNNLMTIEQIHGFLCAIISSPTALPINFWLPTIYGNDKKLISHPNSTEVNLIISQLCDTVVDSFVAQKVTPLIFAKNKLIDVNAASNEQLASWAAGYMTGVALNKKAWLSSGHNEIYEVLTPISAFAQFFDGHQPQDKNAQEIKPQQIRDEYLPLLTDAISNAFLFWRQHQHCNHHHDHHAAPTRHETPKVGRNDPCHCGSGNKFKKCCG